MSNYHSHACMDADMLPCSCGAQERQQIEKIREVYEKYFNLDVEPFDSEASPEPEDVWRFDRDMREVLYPDNFCCSTMPIVCSCPDRERNIGR